MNLANHRSKSPSERAQFSQCLFQHCRERQESERVSCRCSVEHDHRVFHRLDVSFWAICFQHQTSNDDNRMCALHDLRETHRFVYPWYSKCEILHHWTHHSIRVSYTSHQHLSHQTSSSDSHYAHCSTISWIALVGSISIANKFSNPFTFVASFENFWPNASDRLCAGSVDCVTVGLNFLYKEAWWGTYDQQDRLADLR